ncbi:PLP-dependent aminotransferase family protein [Porticoccaceae bacterium LTM1]|nr:PLP-dependent aminotransferase family protein [Porticoccaceae bacterium LTM1]
MSFQIPRPKNIIDLGVGQPDPELLPSALFQSLSLNPEHLAYGEQAGDGAFRRSLARWLSADYDSQVSEESLMVTNGSSNALDMICKLFARRGDTVLVEDPTYFIALRQFAEHGLNVVAVPMDDEGIQLDQLEEAIHKHKPAFIYSIPTYHNPTGICQPLSRREALVQLARQNKCLLVADEVYQQLYFDQRPPLPLACLDANAPVLSIGSFSKILAPGLRLGWIQGAGDLLPLLIQSALVSSGGGLAPVTSALVGSLIDSGAFQEYLAGLRTTLRQRMETVHQCLQAELGDKFTVNKPGGGYFLWATAKDGIDVIDRLPEAKRNGVGFLGGQLFSRSPESVASMRLCFAWYGERELELACRRLAGVFL